MSNEIQNVYSFELNDDYVKRKSSDDRKKIFIVTVTRLKCIAFQFFVWIKHLPHKNKRFKSFYGDNAIKWLLNATLKF